MFGKKNKEEQKSQLELAKAMNRLAEGLEKIFDPIYFQKTIGDAMQLMAQVELTAPAVARVLPPGVTLEAITVRLSDEEREKMTQKIYEALQPQMQEFDNFVKTSLAELPPHRLKEIAEKIEGGAKPSLKRRRGCIFIEMDDGYESYLGL